MSAAKGHSVVPNKHHLPSLVNPQRAGRLTNHLQYLENDVMEELWNHEFSGPFLFPVDPVSLPAYYEFIKNPMDLSTIRKRLRNRYYHHGMECVQDVLSIFINCYTFHKPTDDIILKAKTLQAIFLNKINTMPKLEWDIESEPTRQRQNPTGPISPHLYSFPIKFFFTLTSHPPISVAEAGVTSDLGRIDSSPGLWGCSPLTSEGRSVKAGQSRSPLIHSLSLRSWGEKSVLQAWG
ncbi:Bromodomain testis-specific protein [Takifugu flavidus]|uniref:Bromodomain testis-specific protein n=1 Tax=Takifugu flavidus TaxID=433684 RepID=A0A5C6NJU0_9TELE|nr:Bromodomain testis-specific protein [Takifugu flavidus]